MAPKRQAPAAPAIKETTIVIDNGGFTMKAGFATSEPDMEQCKVIPNCIARDREKHVFVGPQLGNAKDFGEMVFRRPIEKGYVVNWDGEKAIWNQSFVSQTAPLKCDPKETNLILTEAPNCPQALQTNCDQIVFEEFEFASYYRCLGPTLNAYNDTRALFGDPSLDASHPSPAECLLVVDSGYSHTTITPLLNGRPLQPAIRRLPIGGKFLTNALKELISLRHFNVTDEPWLVNEIKEATTFVSTTFAQDLERTWKGSGRPVDTSIIVDYVLPDYEMRHRGLVRPYDPAAHTKSAGTGAGPREPLVTLGNERFAVPELLFHPSDIGMKEAGLPDAILQSVNALPEGLRPAMLANVLVVGGNAAIPGLMNRLTADLRQAAPSNYPVRVASPSDPIKSTWLGGARLVNSGRDTLKSLLVTRAEYSEQGSSWLLRRFAGNAA